MDETIATRLDGIRTRITAAAGRAGRDPASIRLVAVSKTFGLEAVREAAAAGQADFGENKVQEGLQKVDGTPDLRLTWHLLGPIQSNKAKKAAAGFHWIHAVDSVDLLRRLDQAAGAAGTTPHLLIQADLALEPTKHGAVEADLPAIFEAAAACTAARVVGLMLLPPWTENPEDARPWFRRLRELRDGLALGGVPADHLRELSMGMSHDFEVAVEEGATMVRVGTAIFGSRT
ncbi:MAG: YggS family pyridoxal phosphate-dependent enzyme [Vicinamibacterales bacterium]|nr:YggS family pyridoxal phosphate-dependent enzyme [Vicinamibacterales bacterium]